MDKLYYICSHERGLAYNSPFWWGPNSQGYTVYLDKAGKYTKDEAEEICRGANKTYDPNFPNETMHLCREVDGIAHKIFDHQDFAYLKKCDGWKKLIKTKGDEG